MRGNREDDMRKDVSRRKALSLLGSALGLGLALTKDAEAETAGTKSHHAKHPKRSNVQPASAPAEAAPAEFKPTLSPTNTQGVGIHSVRPPLHAGDENK
jgi:hypothetical protein